MERTVLGPSTSGSSHLQITSPPCLCERLDTSVAFKCPLNSSSSYSPLQPHLPVFRSTLSGTQTTFTDSILPSSVIYNSYNCKTGLVFVLSSDSPSSQLTTRYFQVRIFISSSRFYFQYEQIICAIWVPISPSRNFRRSRFLFEVYLLSYSLLV